MEAKRTVLRQQEPTHTAQQGATLVELMMVLAILGIIAGFSMPYLQDMVKNWRITSQTNDLLGDLQSARGQAAATSLTITVCASSNSSSCTGTWSQGRLVFTDANADAAVSTGDKILRVAPAINSTTTLVAANLATAGRLQFRPTGMASGATGSGATFKFCDDRAGAYGRTITVSPTGRASSATSTCP
jgi:type IV fimbrial biogenesis protein FimT